MKATLAERPATAGQLRAGEAARRGPGARRRGTADRARRAGRHAPLRLIAADGRLILRPSDEAVRIDPAAAPVPLRPAPPGPAAPVPVRLTRRGRLVVTAAALLAIAALSVALAGAAQALGHSGAPARPAGTAAITRIQVRAGQNLWSLAESYDPDADPRQVIQQIVQLNSMRTDQVQPGQVLWMPRD